MQYSNLNLIFVLYYCPKVVSCCLTELSDAQNVYTPEQMDAGCDYHVVLYLGRQAALNGFLSTILIRRQLG